MGERDLGKKELEDGVFSHARHLTCPNAKVALFSHVGSKLV